MENSKDIKRLEVSLAFIMAFIPLILKVIENKPFRQSISDYAYSDVSQWFYFLIVLSGSLFLFNGIGYKRHWYNVVLGISLFGVALTPHLDYPIWHYIFATTFFIGSVLSIGFSSNIAFRNFKFVVCGLVVLGLTLHFAFNFFSLLVAEWIGIVPISTHFIIKSVTK